MSVQPFTDDELIEWIGVNLEKARHRRDYILQPGEMTTKSYCAALLARGREITERQAYEHLETLVRAGRMTKRLEKLGRAKMGVYSPAAAEVE